VVLGEGGVIASLAAGAVHVSSSTISVALAEALVGKAGIDKRQYLEILTSTLFGAPVYTTYGGLIADGTFEPAGFAAPLGFKDIRLALAAADDLRVPMPLASLLRDRFLTLLAHGGDKLDWSAIGQLAAKDAGVVGS
jgi:3-hydroxyisobutyrate dehydrogenase-like beta-hydroxyacid dehydrogenase